MTNNNQGPDKLAPNSIEAEEACLGAVLINPPSYYDIDFLQPDDFFALRNGWVWESIQGIVAKGLAVDYLTVIDGLRAAGRLDQIGGSAYLTSLINNTPTHVHAETYAMIVLHAKVRRNLLAAAGEIASVAIDENAPLADIIQHSEAALAAATTLRNEALAVPIAQVAEDFYEHIKDLKESDRPLDAVTTGLDLVDRMLNGGMRRQELVVVAARLKVGKTAFLVNTAFKAAASGKRVLFICMEMTSAQLYARLMSARSGIPYAMLGNKAAFTPDQWKRFNLASGELADLPIYFQTVGALNLGQIRTLCRRLSRLVGQLDLVIVDFLQMMPSESKRGDNRPQELVAIAYGLKHIAREINATVMVACQLNRESDKRADGEPKMSDISGSDGPGQACDVALFPYREDMVTGANTGMAKIVIGAQRNGPTGGVPVKFFGQYMLWADDPKAAKVEHVDLTKLNGEPVPLDLPLAFD